VATREWRIEGPAPHVIRLKHGYWTGRAAIWLDGALIYRRGVTLADFGLEHRFEVDGAEVAVQVICRLLCHYRYQLRVGGRVVAPSAASGRTGPVLGLGCALAILAALLGGWLLLLERWAESVAPGGETLAECLEKMPEPARAVVFSQGGREYLLLWGHWRAFPRFPSGPPLYVFDGAGRLVDWVGESGDNDFYARWPGASEGGAVGREEMMRWPGATR
jgi:hypothetical protein